LGNARAKADHAHELRRDQLAKYFEFRLQEYRERSQACQTLVQGVNNLRIYTLSRQRHEAKKSSDSQSPTGVTIDTDEIKSIRITARAQVQEALKMLAIDARATNVLAAYRALPVGDLRRAPRDKATREAWNQAEQTVQQTVSEYLRTLERDLILDDPGVKA
jgi:hypothetical protein